MDKCQIRRRLEASASGREAVMALAELARERLLEGEKMRHFLLLVAVLAFLVVAIVIVAPVDKQYVTCVLGAVLIIFALGSIDASKLVLKMLAVEVSARDKRLLREIATQPDTGT